MLKLLNIVKMFKDLNEFLLNELKNTYYLNDNLKVKLYVMTCQITHVSKISNLVN